MPVEHLNPVRGGNEVHGTPVAESAGEADSVRARVSACARCGVDHEIVFRRFRGGPLVVHHPDAPGPALPSYSHWGECRLTGEPVLMRVDVEDPRPLVVPPIRVPLKGAPFGDCRCGLAPYPGPHAPHCAPACDQEEPCRLGCPRDTLSPTARARRRADAEVTTVAPAASWLRVKLEGWANQMSMRFGGAEVYLVGSALRSPRPRDVDVSIIMADDAFRERYAVPSKVDPSAFMSGVHAPDWPRHLVTWGREVSKLTHGAQRGLNVGLPLDVKIMHAKHATTHHAGKPRLRLDRLGGEVSGER